MVIEVLGLVVILMVAYGLWEYVGHIRRLRSIPLRIHVNGTRGKSSVTRLIAAGLRAGGIYTMAKTTGTLPRIIDLEGKEVPIIRDRRANIIEQVKIVRYFAKRKPEAIVVECMAVLPELQWFCEHKLIRSHIGVITNARLDHINEMGRFREMVARSLANTIPRPRVTDGKAVIRGREIPFALFTSEKTNFKIFKDIAEAHRIQVQRVGGQGITNEDLKRFSYIEHPANIGLALAVCEHVGVKREVALEGMVKCHPDPGALKLARCQSDGKELLFVNAMAANDPESTLEIYRQITERFSPLGTVIVLLNSRADRQDRSIQLIEMATAHMRFDHFVLTGENMHRFYLFLLRFNVPREKIVGIGWVTPEKVYERLFSLVDGKGTVFAMGNVGAGGLDIYHYFYKHRSTDQ